MIPLIRVPRIVKFIESESTLIDARGQVEGRGWELKCLMGTEFVWKSEKYGKWMIAEIAQKCDCT